MEIEEQVESVPASVKPRANWYQPNERMLEDRNSSIELPNTVALKVLG